MRKNRQDWLEAGLAALAREGVGGLRIEPLARNLGVTKGSFYHHFRSARDFEEQLLAYWADRYLSTAMEVPESATDRLSLLDTVIAEAYGPATEPEIALRTWAQQDEMVRGYVEQVDGVRREFVLQIFRPLASDAHQAQLMADMFFAIAIGSLTTMPRIPPQRVEEMYREFKRLYGLDHI